ncbi:hypothetical protein [Dyadobacter sp. OTU695]|uniref:hypothetical protein n=1 Tax=Dyadobacter sp. OTU695 TaxID=3043860 RepID=UPI00313CA13B
MNEKHIVTAVDRLGNLHISTLLAKRTNDTCELTLRNDALEECHVSSDDFFSALRDLREQIEKTGWRLLVKGAARNVWASGMSRSMGGGIKAYQLEKGIASSLDRMVNIFEPADEAEVGTVAEQEAFFSDWVTSR